jgi:hypothetical protein
MACRFIAPFENIKSGHGWRGLAAERQADNLPGLATLMPGVESRNVVRG